jgi:hypothetical protein
VTSIGSMSTAELLRLWARIMSELRDREILRSSSNPTGDFCEAVVADHFGVELAPASTRGYDLVTNDGTRVQVKGRRWTARSKPSHYSLIRNLDAHEFDLLVAVHLDEDFTVSESWSVPWETVRRYARFNERVSGWRLPIIKGKLSQDATVTSLRLATGATEPKPITQLDTLDDAETPLDR